MSEQIRVGIVGASGGMGSQRVQQFSGDPRSRLVAACARDQGKLAEVVDDTPVHLTTDADDVLTAADVDAVGVCTANVDHYEQVTKALNAGKHVMCEYPLVDDLDQWDELVALAEEKGVVLHHGLTVRAESHHIAMKEALAGLGEPRAAYYRYYGGGKWYIDPERRGDIFCALHIHFIDQLLDFFGPCSDIDAHGTEADGMVSAVVLMKWPSGVVGTIEFGMGFSRAPGYMGTVVTTDGWCGFDTVDGMIVKTVRDGDETVVDPGPDLSKDVDAASFLDQILGTGPALSDLATGREAIALCLECTRKMAGG